MRAVSTSNQPPTGTTYEGAESGRPPSPTPSSSDSVSSADQRFNNCVKVGIVLYALFLAAGIGMWTAGNLVKLNGVKIWNGKMELTGIVVTSVVGGPVVLGGVVVGIICCRLSAADT